MSNDQEKLFNITRNLHDLEVVSSDHLSRYAFFPWHGTRSEQQVEKSNQDINVRRKDPPVLILDWGQLEDYSNLKWRKSYNQPIQVNYNNTETKLRRPEQNVESE